MADVESIGARAKQLQERLKIAREESASWRRLSDAERVEWLLRVVGSVAGVANRASKPDVSAEFALGTVAERLRFTLDIVAAFESVAKLESDLKNLTPTTVDSR